MVAVRAEKRADSSTTARVRRQLAPAEQRAKARKGTALRAWVCGPFESKRAWVLDLSETGCRIGGAGTKLTVGDSVVVKVELQAGEPPLVGRAQVARYHVVAAVRGPGCPDVCLTFSELCVDEWFRLARFLDRTR